MTAQEILNIINADEDFGYGCSFYGLRADRKGLKVGYKFPKSHQWWQDAPSNWGEECEYDEDLQLWDGGELPGTCTLGLGDFPTVESVQRVINRMNRFYVIPKESGLYLVKGDNCEGGEDAGESIIYNAEMVAEI